MIVTTGLRRVAVVADEASAGYGASEGSGEVRWYVELLVAGGGRLPRAALGGTLQPGPAPLRVDIQGSGDPDQIEATTVSHLGKPLCPGLPDEFVTAVRAMLTAGLTGGTVTIDRAAYDPVESSRSSFRMVAEILGALLSRGAAHGPGDEEQIRELIERLTLA